MYMIVNNLGEVWLENLGAILGYLGERMGYLGRAWREVETLLAAWDGLDARSNTFLFVCFPISHMAFHKY